MLNKSDKRAGDTGLGSLRRPTQSSPASLALVRSGERRARAMKQLYGLDFDDFISQSAKTDDVCQICDIGPITHVDHDHETGKFRGLLCHHCNTALGNFRDSKDILKKAIAYLSILSAFFLVSCAGTQPQRHFTAPSVAPVREKIVEARKHIELSQASAKRLADECATKSAGWQDAYDSLNRELADAYLAAKTAEDRSNTLQAENDKLAGECNKVEADRVKAETKEKLTAFKYHRVKALLAAAAAAVVLGALLMFGKGLLLLIPPPWNIVAGVGAPAAAAAAVFFFL